MLVGVLSKKLSKNLKLSNKNYKRKSKNIIPIKEAYLST